MDRAGVAFRPGQTLEVVDVSAPRGPKKCPFAKGAHVVCDTVTDTGLVGVRGHAGYWRAFRFKAVA